MKAFAFSCTKVNNKLQCLKLNFKDCLFASEYSISDYVAIGVTVRII